MRKRSLKQLATLVNVSLVAMVSGGAVAAEDPASAGSVRTAAQSSSEGLEEVIVTARKQQESAQVVPLSITPLSAADLEKQAVLSIYDLHSSVPGLFVSKNVQGGAPTFAIRAAKADNGTSDTVTAYVGDVPMASTRSIANMMYDMQSISVLKGPQGTLFGASTTGGAIVFLPNMPSDHYEGYAEVGIGNYDRQTFQGMFNLPVNDVVQMRIAAEVVDQSKGFEKNNPTAPIPSIYGTGYNGIRDYWTDKHQSARFTLRVKPNESFQNDVEFDYFHEDDQLPVQYIAAYRSPYSYQTFLGFPLTVNIAAAGITAPNGLDDMRMDAYPTWDKVNIQNYIDTATYAINDHATLKAVLGYQDVKLDTLQGPVTTYNATNGRTLTRTKKWTFEPSIDLAFADDRLRNKLGVFLSDTKVDNGISYQVLGLPWDQTAPENNFLASGMPAWQLAGQFYPLGTDTWATQKFKSYAIYDQISYDLSSELIATLGVRYTWDKGDYTATNHNYFPGAPGSTQRDAFMANFGSFFFGNCNANSLKFYDSYDAAACLAKAGYESQAPSFAFTLEDKFVAQSMVYASLRGGYLVGGFNNSAQPPVSGIPITFQPEKVVDFETGLKSDWELFERPIRTNLAVYYGSYKDQQRVQNGTTPSGVTFTGVVNAGASTFYGFDFDGAYEITSNLELKASWNHIESEYTKYNAIVNVPGVYAYVDLSGQPMSQTPKDQVSLSTVVKWPFPSDIGAIDSTLGYSWTAKTTARDAPTFYCTPNAAGQCFGPSTPALDFRAYDELPSYGLWNFTTQWKGIMGSNFDVNVWMKNIFDKKYIIGNQNQMLQFGYASVFWGEPRTFGIEVRYSL